MTAVIYDFTKVKEERRLKLEFAAYKKTLEDKIAALEGVNGRAALAWFEAFRNNDKELAAKQNERMGVLAEEIEAIEMRLKIHLQNKG